MTDGDFEVVYSDGWDGGSLQWSGWDGGSVQSRKEIGR